MAVIINPEVLQTYLLSIAHKTIQHSRNSQTDNKNIIPILHNNYNSNELIKDAQAEQLVFDEVNGMVVKNVYDPTDIEVMRAELGSDKSKIDLLNKFSLSLVIFRKINDREIKNEFPIYSSNNAVQGTAAESSVPFRFEEFNIDNLSKDIYTTKVSQKGSFKIGFKNFTSLKENVTAKNFSPFSTDNISINFSLLNLITYSHKENGEVTFAFKMNFNDMEKLILIRPYKHTFNFYREKTNIAIQDFFMHDVVIEFTAYESSYEFEKDSNLFSRFEIKASESNEAKILGLIEFCQRIEDEKKKITPSTTAEEKANIEAVIQNTNDELKAYLNDETNKRDLYFQTNSLQKKLDNYIFNEIMKNMNIFYVNTTSDKLNVYVLQHSILENFTTKEFAIGATTTIATAFAYAAYTAATAATFAASAVFLPVGLAILGVIATTLLFSNNEPEIKSGTTDVDSTNFATSNIGLIKAKGNVSFTIGTTNINLSDNSQDVLENLKKAYLNKATTSENPQLQQQIVYFYLGDLLNAARGLLKDSLLEEEKFLVGNIASVCLEGTSQITYLLNIADIPISLTFFIDYMRKTAEKTKYNLSFDKLIINFFQDYLKKVYSQYNSIIAKTSNVSLATSTFNPLIKSTYILKQGTTNKESVFQDILTPIGLNNSIINITDIKEKTKDFSRVIRTINKSVPDPSKYSVVKLSFLGSDVKISNIDFVEKYKRSGQDYNGNLFCNYVLENYNIPCITVAQEYSKNMAQIVRTTETDVKFRRIENANLMNSALYNGSNLLNLPYNADIKLLPFMYFYLTNGNYIYIASPLARDESFLFAGLYMVTNSKLNFNILDSVGTQSSTLSEKLTFDVSVTNVWRGAKNTTSDLPTADTPKPETICKDYNEFELVADPSQPSNLELLRLRFRR